MTTTDFGTIELAGGSPGVLLIHGFTGDTDDVRPIAERLNADLGLACYAPLLPGHGVPPHELFGITDEHWLGAAGEALKHLSQQHDEVIVIAFSMGGGLASILLGEPPHRSGLDGAARADALRKVSSFIALAPMIATRLPLLPFTPLISQVMPWFYPLKFMPIDMMGIRKKILQYDPTLNLDDPAVVARLKEEVRIPIAVAEELRKIAKRAIRAASHITLPTLVVQGASDMTLDPDGAWRFYKALGATDKTMLTVATADHDFTHAGRPGNQQMLEAVEGWVRGRIANPVAQR